MHGKWFLAALSFPFLAAAPPAVAQSPIGNGLVSLGYQLTGNDVRLTSIGDATTPAAFDFKPNELWEVTLRDANGGKVTVSPATGTVGSFTITELPTRFYAEWNNVTHPSFVAGEKINVAMFVKAPVGKKEFEISIGVDATFTTRSIFSVKSARLDFRPNAFSSGTPLQDPTLAYPFVGGVLMHDPLTMNTFQINSNPGFASMQWLALFDSVLPAAPAKNPVLTMGTRDGQGYFKNYLMSRTSDPGSQIPTGLLFEVEQFPENNLTTKYYASPYPAVVGVTRGDWNDAAKDYRAWALAQPWASQGPMLTNSSYSSLIKNAKMFGVFWEGYTPTSAPCYQVDNHGSWSNWKRDLDDQLAYFGISTMPMIAYEWEKDSFNANWGEWLPEWSTFNLAAHDIVTAGHSYAVYFHNGVFSEDAPGYATGGNLPGFNNPVSTYTVIHDDGTPSASPQDYCDSNGVFKTSIIHDNCLATDFAKAYGNYYSLETQAVNGARGVYLDTFANSEAICYAANHGHTQGGGKYYSQGKLALMDDLRATLRANDPQYFTATETEVENYLGKFEWTFANIALGYSLGVPKLQRAPLFQAVYHDYRVSSMIRPMLDNQFLSDTLQQLPEGPDKVKSIARLSRYIFAENVHIGYAPNTGSVLDELDLNFALGNPDYSKLADMMKNFMKVLKVDFAFKPVRFGERLRDPKSTVATVPYDDPSFKIYGNQPAVYTSAWHDSTDGGVGILLLNWTDSTDVFGGFTGGAQTFDYTFDLADYGLTPGSYSFYTFSGGLIARININLSGPSYTQTVSVPARSAKFLKFVKNP